MKYYIKQIILNSLFHTIIIFVGIGSMFIYASMSTPSGEDTLGKFMSYFDNMGNSCEEGSFINGFKEDGSILCVEVANGECGSINGVPTPIEPTSSELCSNGEASSVSTGPSSYTWNCNGIGGGTNVSCSAPRQYTVTFNGAGGIGHTPTNKKVVYNNILSTLPTSPTKTGFTFKGWFNSASGGSMINENTIITENKIYYAQWEEEVLYSQYPFAMASKLKYDDKGFTQEQGNTICKNDYGNEYTWAIDPPHNWHWHSTQALNAIGLTTAINYTSPYMDDGTEKNEGVGCYGYGLTLDLTSGYTKPCSQEQVFLLCVKNVKTLHAITSKTYKAGRNNTDYIEDSIYDVINNYYVLVWQDYTTKHIYLSKVDNKGEKIGSDILVFNESVPLNKLKIVYNSQNNNYFIVWQKMISGQSPVSGKIISSAGDVIKDTFEINAGGYNVTGHMDIVFQNGKNRYLVVYGKNINPYEPSLFGKYIDAVGNTIGTEFAMSNPNEVRQYQPITLSFNSYTNRYAIAYQKDSDQKIKIKIYDWNATNTAISGELPEISTHFEITANADNGNFLLFYHNAGDNYLYTRTINTSNTISAKKQLNKTNPITIDWSNKIRLNAKYSPIEKKYILNFGHHYVYINSDNTIYKTFFPKSWSKELDGYGGVIQTNNSSLGGFAFFGNEGDNKEIKVKIMKKDLEEY